MIDCLKSGCLLNLFDDFNQAPALGFAQGAGFHQANGVADGAFVLFVVGVILFGFVHELTINGVFFLLFDGHGDGLVAFIAGNHTHAFFAEISLFFHVCLNNVVLGVIIISRRGRGREARSLRGQSCGGPW